MMPALYSSGFVPYISDAQRQNKKLIILPLLNVINDF